MPILHVSQRRLVYLLCHATCVIYCYSLNTGSKGVQSMHGMTAVVTIVSALQEAVIVDALLVATGRSPNVSGLDLEAAGVQYNQKDGIKVSLAF